MIAMPVRVWPPFIKEMGGLLAEVLTSSSLTHTVTKRLLDNKEEMDATHD
jgi:hypothetical protein